MQPRPIHPIHKADNCADDNRITPSSIWGHRNDAVVQTFVAQLRMQTLRLRSRQFVRVTHPFHPLFGRQLPCVGKRYNRHGKRLLLQVDDAAVWSVPPQWTDLVGSDPAVVMGDGRALLRAVDLLELASLVKRLSDESSLRLSSKM